MRESGTKELYRNNSTGEILTRRDMDDIRAERAGWNSSAEYQAFSHAAGKLGGMGAPAGQLLLYTLENGAKYDETERREFLRENATLAREVAADPDNLAAHGPLARWLEATGIRERNAPYAVGDTP